MTKIIFTLFITTIYFFPSMAEGSRLAVMPLNAQGVEERIVKILTSLTTNEVDALGFFEVVSAEDIQAMLGFEGMKQAVGCTDVSCVAEIGGALGVDLLLTGIIGRLGSNIHISLKLIDIKNARVIARKAQRFSDNEDLLADGMIQLIHNLMQKFAKKKPATQQPLKLSISSSTKTEKQQYSQKSITTAPKTHKGISLIWGISSAGAGLATLAGALLAGKSAQKYEEIAQTNTLSFAETSPQEAASIAESRVLLTNVLLATSTALLVGSIPLFIFGRYKKDAHVISVAPMLTGDGAMVSTLVRF